MKYWIALIALVTIISCKNKDTKSEFASVLKEDTYNNLNDSIQKFPKADTLYLSRALLLTKNKQYEAALQDFKDAWRLEQNEDNGVFLGIGLINFEKHNEAIAHFVTLTQKFPNNLMVRERLGFCFERIGKPNEAINQYDYILKIDSTDYVTMATKAYALEQMDNTTEAIKWFEKSSAGLPNKQTAFELSLLYAETKNPKALTLSDALIQSDSSEEKQVQPYYTKALYYKNIKNYTAALPLLEQCIQLDYTFPDAYLDKAEILYEQKNYAAAIQVLEIAKQNDNANPEVYFSMGKCLAALGKKDVAKLEYERALALDPEFALAKEALKAL